MGNMKANRKFVRSENAVSAVIGVILMVAITVAIAATVYVYVSGMIGGTKKSAPTVQFTKDESADRMIVATTDSGVPWTSLSLRSTIDARFNINGEAIAASHLASANVVTDILQGDVATFAVTGINIAGSDFIDIEGVAAGTDVTISIIHKDTNSVLQTILFTSVQIVS